MMYNEVSKHSAIVQKYGGTSVGSVERIASVAERVSKYYNEGYSKLAIVVSAMSGETNRLVELVHQVNPQAREKIYDVAVSAGEQVSAALLAAALEKRGIPSEPLLAYNVGIFTDSFHAKARIRSIKTDKVEECWARGVVPIIAGFQGITEEHDLTTLGRGGSDTSAVAIAIALKASFCEINTDVDGVYSADPRLVPEAHLIPKMDYESALEMAALGSKVLHSRCVEIAAKYKMPIVVRNSFKDFDSQRTFIMDFASSKDFLEAPLVSGITLDKNVVKISLKNLPSTISAITDLFEKIAKENINVDIIVHNADKERTLGFTIGKEDLSKTWKSLEALKKDPDFKNMTVESEEGLAKISAVGLGMRSYSGVAAKIFSALAKEGITIHMISTSEIKVSCVVSEGEGKKASQALHAAFFET